MALRNISLTPPPIIDVAATASTNIKHVVFAGVKLVARKRTGVSLSCKHRNDFTRPIIAAIPDRYLFGIVAAYSDNGEGLENNIDEKMVSTGLKVGSLDAFSGGFARISSVKAACRGSYKFPIRRCSLSNQTKEYYKNSFYKVKEVEGGGSESCLLVPRTSYAKKELEVETRHDEEFGDIKEGDFINVQDLIFDENRDYVVKYNEQQVRAEQLVGKSILLYFVPVCDYLDFYQEIWIANLIDIYYDLLPNNDFEVILVAVDDPRVTASPLHTPPTEPHKVFESIFSRVPWTAIPFSDLASRKRIAKKFGISEIGFNYTTSILLDAKGMVLNVMNVGYLKDTVPKVIHLRKKG